jgi:putative DNA primase/helicase
VWAWQKKRDRDADGKGTGPRELIPDLDGVAWQGRKVFITFDSDLTDKPDVQWAEYHLADVLRQCGAEVRAVRLPAEADGSKNGLDDFLVRHGPDLLPELVASAVAPARPAGGDDRPKIIIGTDQYRVNGEAIAALAAGTNVYPRAR